MKEKTASYAYYVLALVLGLCLTVVLLEAGLRAAGAVLFYLQHSANSRTAEDGTCKILCIGESTTARGGRDSWPAQLEEILNAGGAGTRFIVFNEGREATQTSYLLANMEKNIEKYRPDMVIAMMGINDGPATVAFDDSGRRKAGMLFSSLRVVKLVRILAGRIRTKRAQEVFLGNARSLSREGAAKKEEDTVTGRSEEELLAAVEDRPGDARARVALACFYRGKKDFGKAAAAIADALKVNDREDWVFIEAGNLARDMGRLAEAEKMYLRAIGLAPDYYGTYVDLGDFYRGLGRFDRAGEMLGRALELAPASASAAVALSRLLIEDKRFDSADKLLQTAIEKNPAEPELYIQLWFCRREQDVLIEESEDLIKRAIAADPERPETYMEAGFYYFRNLGRAAEAEGMFLRAIELRPNMAEPYIELADLYMEQGRENELGALIDSIERKWKDKSRNALERVYAYMAGYWSRRGREDLAAFYYGKASVLRAGFYSPATRANYRRLCEILSVRGIALVCVQYPMRRLESLKRLLEGCRPAAFVDNERSFKDALAEHGYAYLFTDHFGGDFGHATRAGNRLLAENVSRSVLAAVVGKGERK